jgi:hypothetical protein
MLLAQSYLGQSLADEDMLIEAEEEDKNESC